MGDPFGIIPRGLGVFGGVCEIFTFSSGCCLACYIVGLLRSVRHELKSPGRGSGFTCVMSNRIDKKYLKSTAYELKFRVIRDQSGVHGNL